MANLTGPKARRLHIAMKPESVYGTDIFAGTYLATDIIPAIQIQPTLNVRETETLGLGGRLGRNASVMGAQTGGVSFVMPVRGRGAFYDDTPDVVPEAHYPLLGCAHTPTFFQPGISGSTVTYAPGVESSMTIYIVQENGPTVKLTGCVGTFAFSLRADGSLEFRFNFQGQIAGVADVTFVEPTIAATPAYPAVKSAAFQIGTENYAPRISDISFDQQGQIQPVPSVNAASAMAGYFVADRNPRLVINPEANTVATYPWFQKWIDGTLADCTFQVGTTALNRVVFSFPKLQIVNQGYTGRDGLTALPTTLLATVNAGDDDYSIAFT